MLKNDSRGQLRNPWNNFDESATSVNGDRKDARKLIFRGTISHWFPKKKRGCTFSCSKLYNIHGYLIVSFKRQQFFKLIDSGKKNYRKKLF